MGLADAVDPLPEWRVKCWWWAKSGAHSWASLIKTSMGSAGTGKQWHHIVEKRDPNLKRFGPEALHNTENVIPVEAELHTEVSAFYSSNQEFITGSTNMTVRKWLDTQSYEAQRRFGLNAIENIRSGTWRPRR